MYGRTECFAPVCLHIFLHILALPHAYKGQTVRGNRTLCSRFSPCSCSQSPSSLSPITVKVFGRTECFATVFLLIFCQVPALPHAYKGQSFRENRMLCSFFSSFVFTFAFFPFAFNDRSVRENRSLCSRFFFHSNPNKLPHQFPSRSFKPGTCEYSNTFPLFFCVHRTQSCWRMVCDTTQITRCFQVTRVRVKLMINEWKALVKMLIGQSPFFEAFMMIRYVSLKFSIFIIEDFFVKSQSY